MKGTFSNFINRRSISLVNNTFFHNSRVKSLVYPARSISINSYLSNSPSSSLSTSTVSSASAEDKGDGQSSLYQSIPNNIQLADDSVLEAPKTKPEIENNFDPMMYYFPTMNVPETIKVIPLHDVNENEENIAVDTIEANRKLFEVAIRKDIIHDIVRYIRAKKRQPNKTKRVGEIRGSGKKPVPQKGQGRAQFGNKRNSIWRGGMKAHGPRLEKVFEIQLNRKFRALGMMMVVAAKYREGNLLVFDSLEMDVVKTQKLVKALQRHKVTDHRTLIVDEELQGNFEKSCSNINMVSAMPRKWMDVYEIMRNEKLVFSKNSFEQFQKDVVSRYYRKGKGNIQVQAETLQAAEDFTNATRKYPNSDRSKRFTKANL